MKKFLLVIIPVLAIILAILNANFDFRSLLGNQLIAAQSSPSTECDVVIAGGSLSALFSAIASGTEGSNTCLLEPTDWAGGQLTASGVPAIDWQWMKNINPTVDAAGKPVAGIDGNTPHTLRENNNYMFFDWVTKLAPQGTCTVSRNCFLSTDILEKSIKPAIAATPNLKVFYNTVVKKVITANTGAKKDNYTNTNFDLKKITGIRAIQRTLRPGKEANYYKNRLSDDIINWYSESENDDYSKQIINFKGVGTKDPIVIDASEFGDVMVLADAPYLQGNEKYDGSIETLNDQCGQSATFPFNMKFNTDVVPENGPLESGINKSYGSFNFGSSGTWDTVWNYRRLVGTTNQWQPSLAPNQISVMNWKSQGNNGNDYAKQYIFKSKADTKAEIANWNGGLNNGVLRGLEDMSYYFYYFMKQSEPRQNKDKFNLDYASMGTNNGLYKMPYLRDIRRSIGIDNYLLKTSEMLASKPTGHRFMDRIATANYPYDIHPMDNCKYSEDDIGSNLKEGKTGEPYPFYVSFRSLTNKAITNMLVSGKSMAQSFKASASTRLQPGEATTGTAAGVSASYMSKNNLSSYDVVEPKAEDYRSSITKIQTNIKKYQPLDWNIGGVKYPKDGEYTENIRTGYFCPNGTVVDLAEGWCYDETSVYGPFSAPMVSKCFTAKRGASCSEAKAYKVGDKNLVTQKWDKLYARQVRGNGECLDGLTRSTEYPEFCLDNLTPLQVYGPFPISMVDKCAKPGAQGGLGGGNTCLNNRFSPEALRLLSK
jgi:hypothetical protein